MKRFGTGLFSWLMVALVAAATGAFFVPTAQAQVSLATNRLVPVKWLSSVATVCTGCPAESTTRTLTSVTDTSAAINGRDIMWALPNIFTAGTTTNFMRVYVVTPNTSTLDSLTAILDAAVDDGGPWFQCAAKVAVTVQTSGDKIVPITFLAGANNANYGAAWLHPYYRVRITGCASGAFSAAKLYVYKQANPGVAQ